MSFRTIIALAAGLTTFAAGPTMAAQCGVVQIKEISAIKVSSGTDNDVNVAFAEMAGAMAQAQGKANVETGKELVGKGGKVGALGALLVASGGSLQGFAAGVKGIPAVASAVDNSRDDPDDFYMSLSTDTGHEAAFLPGFQSYDERFRQGTTVSVKGIASVVPYVLGLEKNWVAVQLWDHDGSSRDDHLGEATFSLADAGKGPLNTVAISDKHGGVAYGIRYVVHGLPCNGMVANMFKDVNRRQDMVTLTGGEAYARQMMIGYPLLILDGVKL